MFDTTALDCRQVPAAMAGDARCTHRAARSATARVSKESQLSGEVRSWAQARPCNATGRTLLLLFGYVRRSMPLDAPGSMKNDDVYSVVAFILGEAGIVPKEGPMDAAILSAVMMPNREGFVPDDRPDVPSHHTSERTTDAEDR